jgi:hypothetical protein
MKKRIGIPLLMLLILMTSNVAAQMDDLLYAMGSGDTVLKFSLDVMDFPLFEFHSTCGDTMQPVTVTAFFDDGSQVPILDYVSCDSGGVFYIGQLMPRMLELIQVESDGEWELSFILSEQVPWSEAPVTVKGKGAGVFAVNNYGKSASFQTDAEEYFTVTQYSALELGEFNTVFNGYGSYSGQKVLKNGFPLFQVNTNGNWELSFGDGGPILDYYQMFEMTESQSWYEPLGLDLVLPDFLHYQAGMGESDSACENYFLYYLLTQFDGAVSGCQIDNFARMSDPEERIPEILNDELIRFYQSAYLDEDFPMDYPLYGKQVPLAGNDYHMVWRSALVGKNIEITFFIVAPDDSGNFGPYEIYVVFSTDIYPKG